MSKMPILTKSPSITFEKVPPANVSSARDHKLIRGSYGKPLTVEELKYSGGALSAVTVQVAGRSITVSLVGTDCAYGLKFAQIDIQTEQPYIYGQELFNRVR